MVQSKALRPDWLPAVALSAILAAVMLVWHPPVGDLAAQVFRTELFDQSGLAIWNGSWYGGHYTLTYSVLFPPLAALLGPRLVGTLAVVASAYLFDRLVRDRWGEAARPATLWFAAGVVTLLADGQLTFALGVVFALAALRALQTNHPLLAYLAAIAAALSSPVAAVFLAGVLLASTWDWENAWTSFSPKISRARVRPLRGLTRGWRGRGFPLFSRGWRGHRGSLAGERGFPYGRDGTRGSQPQGPATAPPPTRDRPRGPEHQGPSTAHRPAIAVATIALALTLLPNLLFPGAGQFPFAFSSYLAIPLWCAAALYLTRGIAAEEGRLRQVVLAYALAATAIWLVPNAMGGNAIRMGALFGGPVIAAVLLARRPRAPVWLLVLFFAGSLYWQLTASVTQIARSVGDPSTKAAYFAPVAEWLRANGGDDVRIEVPPTVNHWESAYLAPEFELARGWLRQLDTTREAIFYGERPPTHAAYRAWLRDSAVRYVALPGAALDYSAEAERRLILADPPYLDLRWSNPDWRVYEVRDPAPLAQPLGGGEATVRWLGQDGFALDVARPGAFLVRVAFTPYWSIARGNGCLHRHGEWTRVRAARPGVFRVAANFSLPRAWKAATGASRTC